MSLVNDSLKGTFDLPRLLKFREGMMVEWTLVEFLGDRR